MPTLTLVQIRPVPFQNMFTHLVVVVNLSGTDNFEFGNSDVHSVNGQRERGLVVAVCLNSGVWNIVIQIRCILQIWYGGHLTNCTF